jgi:hypothetical protein
MNCCIGLLKDSIGSFVIEQVFKKLCHSVTYWAELKVSGLGWGGDLKKEAH